MGADVVAIATEGLAAWRRGDFEALETILDPKVQWFGLEPSEADCNGREDVMRVLRERYDQGFARGDLDLSDAGADSVIAVSHPSAIGGPEWPDETAIVMRLEHGRVVSMRDYPSEAEALAAALNLRTITAEELFSRIEADESFVLIDALAPMVYAHSHLPGAINVHPSSFEPERIARRIPDPDTVIVVYCSNPRCDDSVLTARRLLDLGYTNVRHYAGGKDEWREARLPLERAGKPFVP